jgi:hypothetical protein
MAEAHENLVLRLLREIREKQDDDSLRLRSVERTLQDVKENVAVAMGVAGDASAAVDRHGQDFDALQEKVALLERRLAALENRA